MRPEALFILYPSLATKRASVVSLSGSGVSWNQVYFFEEGIKSGGIGEHIGSMLLQKGYKGKFVNTAIENEFVAASNVSSALKKNNLDRESMIRIISGD